VSPIQHLFLWTIWPAAQILVVVIFIFVGLSPLYITAATWWCIVLLLDKSKNGRPARPITLIAALLASSYILLVTVTAVVELASTIFQSD
jgi:hypothetical protein